MPKKTKKSDKRKAIGKSKRQKKARRIMVFDDEPDIRETLQILFEMEGYEVRTMPHCDECYQHYLEHKPHFVLVDILVPASHAEEIVALMTDSKVAYMSAARLPESEKKRLLKLKHVVDFIEKPFDVEELLDKLDNHLR
ncbi:MAG: response regulator [Nanoarchaeota archaeon]